jgi:hypothetical protein
MLNELGKCPCNSLILSNHGYILATWYGRHGSLLPNFLITSYSAATGGSKRSFRTMIIDYIFACYLVIR